MRRKEAKKKEKKREKVEAKQRVLTKKRKEENEALALLSLSSAPSFLSAWPSPALALSPREKEHASETTLQRTA